jgi:hypothetical protein
MAFRQLGLPMLLLTLFVLNFSIFTKAQQINLFHAPPDFAKSRVYWFWEYNRVTKAGITRDLEQFRAKGITVLHYRLSLMPSVLTLLSFAGQSLHTPEERRNGIFQNWWS